MLSLMCCCCAASGSHFCTFPTWRGTGCSFPVWTSSLGLVLLVKWLRFWGGLLIQGPLRRSLFHWLLLPLLPFFSGICVPILLVALASFVSLPGWCCRHKTGWRLVIFLLAPQRFCCCGGPSNCTGGLFKRVVLTPRRYRPMTEL